MIPVFAVVELPAPAEILASTTYWANPFFAEFWPYARWGLALVVVGGIIAIIWTSVIRLFAWISERVTDSDDWKTK